MVINFLSVYYYFLIVRYSKIGLTEASTALTSTHSSKIERIHLYLVGYFLFPLGSNSIHESTDKTPYYIKPALGCPY